MYSLLVASRQLYGDFVVELLAQLLNPTGTQAKQQEPMKVLWNGENCGGMANSFTMARAQTNQLDTFALSATKLVKRKIVCSLIIEPNFTFFSFVSNKILFFKIVYQKNIFCL